MKKVLSILTVAVLLIATSCSKESKLNRKLDGKWTFVSTNGVATPADEVSTMEFEKDKKAGTCTLTEGPFVLTGTYTLTKDEAINMTLTFWGSTDVEIWKVTDYSKKEMTLTDEDGENVYKLTKN
jgi:hypothetical protein